MFGLISQLVTADGRRDELAEILIGSTAGMPGCLSYVIANDLSDADALWITEIWESREKHQASLQLPAIQEAMGKGKSLIAAIGTRIETTPLGGHGI